MTAKTTRLTKKALKGESFASIASFAAFVTGLRLSPFQPKLLLIF